MRVAVVAVLLGCCLAAPNASAAGGCTVLAVTDPANDVELVYGEQATSAPGMGRNVDLRAVLVSVDARALELTFQLSDVHDHSHGAWGATLRLGDSHFSVLASRGGVGPASEDSFFAGPSGGRRSRVAGEVDVVADTVRLRVPRPLLGAAGRHGTLLASVAAWGEDAASGNVTVTRELRKQLAVGFADQAIGRPRHRLGDPCTVTVVPDYPR